MSRYPLFQPFFFARSCQLESLGRLVAVAEERLAQDKELVKELKEDIQSADNPETKQGIDDRLNITNDHISEMLSEIKRRQETAAKVSEEVTKYSDAKSRIQQQIESNLYHTSGHRRQYRYWQSC